MTGFGAEQKRCHLADGLPLTLRDRSLAVRRSDGKVCPRPDIRLSDPKVCARLESGHSI